MAAAAQQQLFTAMRWRRRGSMVQDALLVVVSGVFAVVHGERALGGNFSSIFFALEQGFLVVMFLTRRRSEQTSTRPADWIVATIGGWGPLFLQPAGSATAAEAVGIGIQLAGLLMTLIGFSYLGKSFGIVAANRGVKVNGPYRLVRHPIYFAHFVTLAGFQVANPSPVNVAIFAAIAACQVLRIQAEERVLTESTGYRLYRDRVRWRLLPGLY